MPAYKNRPHMAPDTPVWRYLSLDAVIATVRDRKLRFTQVDKFEDPFEGSVPKQTIDSRLLLFAGAYQMRDSKSEDPWVRMMRLRRNQPPDGALAVGIGTDQRGYVASRRADLIRLTPLSNVIDRKRVLARHAS